MFDEDPWLVVVAWLNCVREMTEDFLELWIVHLLAEESLDVVQGIRWKLVRAREGGLSYLDAIFVKSHQLILIDTNFRVILNIGWRLFFSLLVLDGVVFLVDVDSCVAI